MTTILLHNVYAEIVWYVLTESKLSIMWIPFNWIICFWADIHAAVKEIANINNVDLLKIRNMMLEKWICKTGPAVTKVCHSDRTFIFIN